MKDIKIGKKIVEYRRLKGITIRNFADLTGLSTSLISQLERDMGNPSLSALQSIASALNIPLFALFMGQIDNASLILRKRDRKKIYDPDHKHVLYDILTPSPLKSNLEIITMNLKSKSETFGGFSQHEGEEIAYILDGEVYIIYEDEEFLLHEGDTARILPTQRHRFRNDSNKDVNVLFVRSNPI